MSLNPEGQRIWRLIGDSLGPYTGSEIPVSSREDEKNFLIAVSQVLRQVQLWTRELDCSSDSETEAKSAPNHESSGEFDLHSEECRCLCDIVCDMMVLLKVDSGHVRHATGKLLLAVSDFVSASMRHRESNWRLFINLLFVCAQLSLSNISSHPSTPRHEDPRSQLQSYILLKKPCLQNAGCLAVAEITRVLRCIWKNLMQEDCDDLVQAYLDSLNYFLLKIPLDLLDEIYAGQNGGHKNGDRSDSLSMGHSLQLEHVFLGYLVQLLCSVIGQIVPVEVQSGSFSRHLALSSISDLVPKLFYWCLCGQEGHANACILVYFRHKLLMLTIRLSIPDDFQCNFGSWLELLHSYLHEFLWDLTAEVHNLSTNSLEGSPFASVVPNKKMHILSIPHIQRQATYLFLRCCFGLFNLQGRIDKQCNCVAPKSGSNLVLNCCNHKKGLKDLSQWLKRNVAAENLCQNKDDLLFKVLLQMLKLPLNGTRESCEERRFPDMEEDFLLHVSDVFNPITIFHIFLAEIHYDHQVLLDYLISKDTGISCAQYLLRCLRMILDKFEAFLEFQVDDFTEEPSSKRRKPSMQGRNELADVSSLLPRVKHLDGDHVNGYKNQKIRGQPFEEAKRCLLSLKDSLESLNQKNLFPYNPKALLKRLMEFQELCYQQQKCTF
ncbi:uncharacterized protein LOC116210864 isoform X2 [Punica granatum]|uniref:Uncharacterized protein LOC116210864 isoform X2 n=1 Tax=Punica granatum TaxID=22663 RepID=A0A6P8E615_PUNGR|nr:uncharacterized protein LOC116210864 isoform X2 [Punica granatum]